MYRLVIKIVIWGHRRLRSWRRLIYLIDGEMTDNILVEGRLDSDPLYLWFL